jgi:cell division cycle 14
VQANQLNEPDSYDKRVFTDRGLEFFDLHFEDCSAPSPETVRKFFDICDKHADGQLAIHCLAGLGRTGTLIALWMMRYHHFKARSAIAWLRLMRPGSIIGEQQQFLESCQGATHGPDNTMVLAQAEEGVRRVDEPRTSGRRHD